MSILNVVEIAGSMTAVAALAGCGLVYLGAMCVSIIKQHGIK